MKKNKGFTLLETLVAIAIMTVAVGAAFSIAQKSISSSFLSKNQTTASFLAAEGIELVREIRDNVAIYNETKGTSIDWLGPLRAYCFTSSGCDIDASSQDLDIDGSTSNISDPSAIYNVKTCGTSGTEPCKLKIHGVAQGKTVYTSRTNKDGTISMFVRYIYIIEIVGSGGKNEAVVVSTVSWPGNAVSLTDTLSNWNNKN